MARSNEPIFWSLFAGGGMVAAMLMPVTVVLTGFAVVFGWLSEQQLLEAIRHPIGRLYLFALISLPLFHAAHRLRFTLDDMGLKAWDKGFAIVFYTGALVGTVAAAWILLGLPSNP
jgi:fumarate reductase subunit D